MSTPKPTALSRKRAVVDGPRRYSTGASDLARLLVAARNSNGKDTSLHGAVADELDESHPGNKVAGLIRRQFGLGEHGGHGPRESVGEFGPFYNSWDGTFPYHARLGRHGPFNLYLTHEQDNINAPQRARWIVRAVSRLPGSQDTGYNFEFPHEEAHLIPQMFPAAAAHIQPHPTYGDGSSGENVYPDYREREARSFDNEMDRQERNRE